MSVVKYSEPMVYLAPQGPSSGPVLEHWIVACAATEECQRYVFQMMQALPASVLKEILPLSNTRILKRADRTQWLTICNQDCDKPDLHFQTFQNVWQSYRDQDIIKRVAKWIGRIVQAVVFSLDEAMDKFLDYHELSLNTDQWNISVPVVLFQQNVRQVADVIKKGLADIMDCHVPGASEGFVLTKSEEQIIVSDLASMASASPTISVKQPVNDKKIQKKQRKNKKKKKKKVDDQEYLVEEIMDMDMTKGDTADWLFMVKWADGDVTWEPKANVHQCEAYHSFVFRLMQKLSN